MQEKSERRCISPGWPGYGGAGQVEDGLAAVAEALRLVDKHTERIYEAEVYRIKGALTLQSRTSLRQVSDKSRISPEQATDESQTSHDKSEDTNTQTEADAEACFL